MSSFSTPANKHEEGFILGSVISTIPTWTIVKTETEKIKLTKWLSYKTFAELFKKIKL